MVMHSAHNNVYSNVSIGGFSLSSLEFGGGNVNVGRSGLKSLTNGWTNVGLGGNSGLREIYCHWGRS